MSSRKIDPSKSIKRALAEHSAEKKSHVLKTSKKKWEWASKMDRVRILREGLPFESVDLISKKADLSVKQILAHLGMAQTTYNKKKREGDLLMARDAEHILVLSEVLDLGLEVFNQEGDKFYRWLKKPNISLGNVSPESLFDSLTGIQEVQNALNRIEYGNFA